MFTSRAEYRLGLRADNADQRLTPKGVSAGLVSGMRGAAYRRKAEALERGRAALESVAATPQELRALGIEVNLNGTRRTAYQLLAYPNVTIARLSDIWPALRSVPPSVARQVETDGRYQGYLQRQEADIRAFRRDQALELPPEFDYRVVGGLSTEVRSKLECARPATLAAAARIPGVTPAALTALLAHVRKREGTGGAACQPA
jgi:tRNA uridine 5-carboxymethylaminomethyl modification enzyme